jgi:hypothetical protein
VHSAFFSVPRAPSPHAVQLSVYTTTLVQPVRYGQRVIMFSISNRKQWIFLSPVCLSVILEYLVLRANCQLTVANAECLFHLPSHLIVCKTHAPLYHLFTREITFPHWPVNNLHFSPDEGSLIYLIFQCQIVCGAQALIVSTFTVYS